MKQWDIRQLAMTLLASTTLWAVVAAGCLMIGSTGAIGWPSRLQFEHRIELVLLASLVGAVLAAAGVVYQAILQNPLADPYLLGISTGASLAAYLWRFAGVGGAIAIALSQQAFAFTGALLAVAVVFSLAGARGRLEPLTLLLVGVIVNAVNASIYLLLNSIFRELPGSGGPLTFLVGGLQTNLESGQLLAAAAAAGVGWLILLAISGQLNVAVLSEGEAMSLGVRIHRLRWVALIVASLMTASAVAVSGPIGFVGLVCPHLGRLVAGHDHRRLLPVATAMGAALLAIADAAARKIAGEGGVLLPVGVLTGLLGGPFFLLLLWQRRRQQLS
ncbi:MAG TPA: iron ABC transporter permease [Tepidisphaeraceae bacterium]|nr:iron ABC transporter permease [Tepidisphaeraceae bacterium]